MINVQALNLETMIGCGPIESYVNEGFNHVINEKIRFDTPPKFLFEVPQVVTYFACFIPIKLRALGDRSARLKRY